MNVSQLREKLNSFGVPNNYYSINENLISDTYVLNQVYDKWEYFYFDEKGNKNDYRQFDCESEACAFFFDKLSIEMKYTTQTHSNN